MAGVASTHEVAIVLGSGWGAAVDELGEVVRSVPMAEAGFPVPTVGGHAGRIASVDVGARHLLVLQGRVHLYEGFDAAEVVRTVRAAVESGCTTVVLTNAAGALRPDLAVGAPVLIADHLNLTGRSPLAGPRPAFVDLTDLYSTRLRALARSVDPALREGVYAGLVGPHYETPAEIRMLATLGADLVGMSTVLEAIAARQLGAEVLGISLVTNPAAGLTPTPIDHTAVVAAAASAAVPLGRLLRSIVEAL